MLEQARALHAKGQFAEAERIYVKLIQERPQDFRAWHGLGTMTMNGGWPDRALPLLDRARALNPREAAVHGDLGRCCHMTGQLRDAVASFERAIALAPGQAENFNGRALALHDLGDMDAALASADRAIVLRPDFAEAHNTRGLALSRLVRPQEALASFESAIAISAEYADAHNNRALALAALDRPDEALDGFARVLAIAPGFAMAYANRGSVFTRLKRHGDALADFDSALALAPDNGEYHYNRANALLALRRHEAALESYDQALARQPQFADALANRTFLLARTGRYDDALAGLNQLIGMAPDMMGAYSNRALVLVHLGRMEEALATHDLALARNPDYAEDARFSRSILALLRGQWREGWLQYEARRTCSKPVALRSYPQPQWLGEETLVGKTLYVRGEQGLGDTIQFSRYLALAKAQGANVLFSPQDALARLFKGFDPAITILPWQEDAPAAFDYHVPLMSLPLAFATTEDTIPAAIPYLSAEPERAAQWRSRIGEQGFRVGLCWHAGDSSDLGPERGFALGDIAPLAQIPGIRFISLQKGDGVEQLADLPPGLTVETLGEDFDAGPDAFVDSAAAMQSLDLVISCDTAIAHLAGALGRPVWVALKQVPEWRWLLERSDSPWYPTMTLFRQAASGDWGGVFAAMRTALAEKLQ